MLKRISLLVLAALMLPMLFGCGSKTEGAAVEPDLLQIRSICNLATLECYYHNVAASTKKAESGITHIGEQDRDFWVEYDGIIKLGIDASDVQIEISGDEVEVAIPGAKVLDCSVNRNSYGEDSFYTASDALLNKNPITADDRTEAVNTANEEMKQAAENDEALLMQAQNRAARMIENYIRQIGSISGVDYKITWVYADNQTDQSIDDLVSDAAEEIME